MANNYVVPGFYATIEDYQLSTQETAQTLSENAIVYFGDLPDFVYVADEQSTDVNAVKRVRITPNTILPVTDTNKLIQTLTGDNILDGILTQEQKDELICKDMINVIKMSESLAARGELAIVKIVKRDGTRPDINNKFEVFQALENAYEKLGNVRCSQIVPVGIAGDEDFVSNDDKAPVMQITRPAFAGGVEQENIFNDIYSFSPVQNVTGMKVEFEVENQEFFNHTAGTAESNLIKEKGIDSDEVKHLLTGKVLVNGKESLTGLPLKYEDEKFVLTEETKVELIKGEANVILGVGTIFATVKTEELDGKKVVSLTEENKPLFNFYVKSFEVKAEIKSVEISANTCKVGEELIVSGQLKESLPKFNLFKATLSGEGFEVVEEPKLYGIPHIDFQGKVRATAEGAKKLKFEVSDPTHIPFVKEFDVTVTPGEAVVPKAKKKVAAKDEPTVAAVTEVYDAGKNQFVLIDIIKPTSNWIEIKNLGNVKEVVDKIAILEGKKDGVEQYTVSKSGTVIIKFAESAEGNGQIEAIIEDTAEVVEPKHYPLETTVEGWDVVLAKDTYLEWEGINFILNKGLLLVPEPKEETESVYFDEKVDAIKSAEYLINYVPANSEPIMSSLKYVNEQVNSFSEVLMVWGVRPATSSDPNVVTKYVNSLVNLPKFKRGFKVRTSATREQDLGMFLTVVAGTIKVNGIGGISNFTAHRVVDYEREQGGIGAVKPLTDKVFVELNANFSVGSNVELKTYVGVKQKTFEAVVLSTKEVMGRLMLTLSKKVDTTVFDLNGFEVMISNTDSKDRHGSYAAAAFAIAANLERDRSPLQKDIDGVADFSFSQDSLRTLIENKFTVINKNLISGKGTIVDTPVMSRKDSDYQERSSIGTVLTLLNALRKVANEKKGKRFPKKEDKVLLEDELRNVFVNELNKPDSLITAFQFQADMSRLDTKGFLGVKFRISDAKKLKTVEFAGGLAKLF